MTRQFEFVREGRKEEKRNGSEFEAKGRRARRTYLSLGDELISSRHLTLSLGVLVDDGLVESSVTSDDRDVGLLDDLLRLLGRGRSLSLDGSSLSLHRSVDDLLLLRLLVKVSSLEREDSVEVESGLDLDGSGLSSGGLDDVLEGSLSDPGRDVSREILRVGVLGLELEGSSSREGEDLGRRNGVSLGEDEELGSLLLGGVDLVLLPEDGDGVGSDVLNGEVSNLEDGREDGASEGGSSSDGFVLVEGDSEGLSREESGDSLLDGGNSRRSSNELDGVDIGSLETGVGEGSEDGSLNSGENLGDETLELDSSELGGRVDVVHDGLDVERSLGVGGEDLLELLASSGESEDGLGGGEDVDLVLGLELSGEVLNESEIEVSSSEVSVVGGRLDVELSLRESSDGDRVVGVSDVDEHDVLGRFRSGGEIRLGDSVTESDGGEVVDESERVESGDGGGVEHGSSLVVGVPSGDSDNDVRDGLGKLESGLVSKSSEEHGDELGSREDGGLSEVVDLGDEKTKKRRRKRESVLMKLERTEEKVGGKERWAERRTHLDSNASVDIDELAVEELALDLLDLYTRRKQQRPRRRPNQLVISKKRHGRELKNSPGSSNLLPINLLRDPTVFLKLEVSAVLAASPMYRCRAVKEMRELRERGRKKEGRRKRDELVS